MDEPDDDAELVDWEAVSDQDSDGSQASEPADDAEVQQSSVLGVLRDWLPVLIIAVLLTLIIRFFIFQPYEIPSGSMLPTLEPGDRVVVNRLSYMGGDLQRGQVVVFERPPSLAGEDDMIKRVVGLPGETVRFENNAVYIGMLRMVEPYLVSEETTNARTGIPGCAESNVGARTCVVPDGYVFVLGDNRSVSTDSRSFGPVPIDTIIGRATLRVWPPQHFDQL